MISNSRHVLFFLKYSSFTQRSVVITISLPPIGYFAVQVLGNENADLRLVNFKTDAVKTFRRDHRPSTALRASVRASDDARPLSPDVTLVPGVSRIG